MKLSAAGRKLSWRSLTTGPKAWDTVGLLLMINVFENITYYEKIFLPHSIRKATIKTEIAIYFLVVKQVLLHLWMDACVPKREIHPKRDTRSSSKATGQAWPLGERVDVTEVAGMTPSLCETGKRQGFAIAELSIPASAGPLLHPWCPCPWPAHLRPMDCVLIAI